MSLNTFIPQIWAQEILLNLHKSLVYAGPGVVNRDYEGEIKQKGDTVKINAIGAVTVANYVKNTNMDAPQALTGAQTLLTITQQKYFNFGIDDIDRAQAQPKVMSAAMLEAGYAVGNDADQFIAALYSGAATANLIGSDASPKTPTASTAGTSAYDYLVQLGIALSAANVPDDGQRWVIVPPWFYGFLQLDQRFVSWQQSNDPNALRTGYVGRAVGFTILRSNNVTISAASGGGHYKIMAGHPMAITYADQILEVEAYRPQLQFNDAMKGLHLYGASVVRPTALAVLTADYAP